MFKHPDTTFKTDHVSLGISFVDFLRSHKNIERIVSFLYLWFPNDTVWLRKHCFESLSAMSMSTCSILIHGTIVFCLCNYIVLWVFHLFWWLVYCAHLLFLQLPNYLCRKWKPHFWRYMFFQIDVVYCQILSIQLL